MKKLLKVLVVSALVLVSGLLLGIFVFSVQIAQWSLDRLQTQGFAAQVTQANLLSGHLLVRHLKVVRVEHGTTFSLTAKEGEVSLGLLEVLKGGQSIPRIRVEEPSITVMRAPTKASQTPTPRPKPKPREVAKASDKAKQSKDAQQSKKEVGDLLQSYGGRFVGVRWLEILRGRVLFVDRSQPGKSTRVRVASLTTKLESFQGTIHLEGVKVHIQAPKMKMRMKIPKAQAKLNLEHFFKATPLIEEVRLFQPAWQIEKTGKPSQAQLAKEAKERAEAHKGLKMFAPSIKLFQLVGGSLSLQENKSKTEKVHVHIPRFDAKLVHFRGTIALKKMKVNVREYPMRIRLRMKEAKLQIDLTHLLHGMIQLPYIGLDQPNINVVMDGMPKEQALPWLGLGKVKIRDGTLSVTLPPMTPKKKKTRRRRKKARRIVRLRYRVTGLNGDLRSLSLRYILARPFYARVRFSLTPYGTIRLRARPVGAKVHRLALRSLPISAANQMLGQQDAPIRMQKGLVHVSFKFTKRPNHRVRVLGTFQIHRIQTQPNGAKHQTPPFQLVTRLINDFFKKHPKGIQLHAAFSMTEKELATQTHKLGGLLGKRVARGLFVSLFKQIPALQPFRDLLWDHLQGGKRRKFALRRLLRKIQARHKRLMRDIKKDVDTKVNKLKRDIKRFGDQRKKEAKKHLARVKKEVDKAKKAIHKFGETHRRKAIKHIDKAKKDTKAFFDARGRELQSKTKQLQDKFKQLFAPKRKPKQRKPQKRPPPRR